MAVFVLVHGAFHGGWCYARVARRLRAHGHDVFTPTLTGVGERAHIRLPGLGLATHVEDIVSVIRCEDLSDIILCGHSYGGMVITGVAAQVSERIRSLVYIDAVAPANGQSLADLYGDYAGTAVADPSAWGDPPPAAFFNVNPADAAWVEARMTPHPYATFVEPAQLTGAERLVPCRTIIAATNFGVPIASNACRQLAGDPAWRTVEIISGHDIMIDAPEALAEELLVEAARIEKTL